MPESEKGFGNGEIGIRIPWSEEERAFTEGVVERRLNSFVTEFEIRDFCRDCDLVTLDGVCKLGPYSQLRYVARKWCGTAFIAGEKGRMTEEGFIPEA